jgi:Tol biopolymer transport system component
MNTTLILLVRTLVWGILAGASALSIGLRPVSLAGAGAGADSGVIAFVTSVNGREDQIRLIDPTGGNNRLLWSTGDRGVETQLHYVANLAWKPDGSELAFHSSHEAACSFFGSDVYGIRSNGTNLRRIVSPPTCGQNTGAPTGSVQVTFYNQTDQAGPFIFYFQGAPAAQSGALPPYGSLTVTFNNVIDYGSEVQWAVAALGYLRFLSSECHADVIPGQTVETAVIMGYAYEDWAIHSPTWNYDGTQIAYLFGGEANPYGIAADNTTPGNLGAHLLTPASDGTLVPFSSGFLAYGPTQVLANQLLFIGYNEGSNIYRMTVGQSEPGEILLGAGDLGGDGFTGLAWLPDGSGFLYAMGESFFDVANVFRYSFSTGQSERLTDFSSGWARRLAVSPDGSRVVFEYQSTGTAWDEFPLTDLYTMNIDGTDPQLLVAGGRSPAWGPQAVPEPTPAPLNHRLFLPLISH